MEEGYWIAVGAKPLHVVDDTFCSVPKDGANCKYLVRLISGASETQCKPEKRGFDSGVSAASPMIKSAKRMEKIKKKVYAVIIAYLSLVESLCFILEFLLNPWKDNLVNLAIESLFPYQIPILLDFWRDNIANLVILLFLIKDQFSLIKD